MKKIALFMILLALGVAVPTGCGSGQQNAQPQDTVSVSEQIQGAQPEDTVSVSEQIQDAKPEDTVSTSEQVQDESVEGDDADNESTPGYEKTDAEWDFPKTGFVLKVSDSMKNLKGQLVPDDYGELDIDAGVYFGVLYYVPRSDEETESAAELLRSCNSENDPDGSKRNEIKNDYYANGYAEILGVVGFRDDMSLDDALGVMRLSKDVFLKTGELGQEGSLKYYYLVADNSEFAEEYRETFSEEYYHEYELLIEDIDTMIAGISLKEPEKKEDVIENGKTISFETKDLDGNTVTSEELFAGHKVTMINIWATWCGPCRNEMPELENLSREITGKDCRIIGICDDTLEDNGRIEEAKAILEKAGVTYINLVQTEELRELLPITAYPTTYFVDSEGRIMTQPVVGAYPDRYRDKLEEAAR